MERRRQFLRTTALAAVATLAGCDGDGRTTDGGGRYDGSTATETPTDVHTTTGTAGSTDTRSVTGTGGPTDTATGTRAATPTGAAETAREAYPGYNWAKLDGESGTATTTVTLENLSFNPLVATVSAGESVDFPNQDGSAHTVTIPKLRIDRQLAGGASTTVTFDSTGTYEYVCTLHPPEMLGRIVVE